MYQVWFYNGYIVLNSTAILCIVHWTRILVYIRYWALNKYIIITLLLHLHCYFMNSGTFKCVMNDDSCGLVVISFCHRYGAESCPL